MAIVCANKKLTLANNGNGLDFTMDSPHEVVSILSGITKYAQDPWVAWRSAFRECIKLKHSLPNIENQHRLDKWLSKNLQGDVIGNWSICGAQDAMEYYDSVQGRFEALRLSYEWSWLEQYFENKYKLHPQELL